jgi:hypothetical protein
VKRFLGPAFDFGAPMVAYYALLWSGVGTVTALVVAAAIPALSVAYVGVRHRRFDKAAGFTLAMVVVGILAAVITGSVRLVFAKAALFTFAAGVWFLVTARTRAPISLVLSRPLLKPVTAPGVSWDELWDKEPRFRRIWRVCTVIMGGALVLDAFVRAWIAYAMPVEAVPALTTAQYVVFTVLMLVITNIYQARAGLFPLLRFGPAGTPTPPPAPAHRLAWRVLSAGRQ